MIVPSQLQVLVAAERQHDAAPMKRMPRRRRRAHGDAIEIRRATARDAGALRDLEALDGRSLTAGSRLVAELGGVPVAAIAVADDTVVADPFEHTAGVVDLLRVRARQLRIAGTPRPAPRLALIERLAR
jgi:hypothetical protein